MSVKPNEPKASPPLAVALLNELPLEAPKVKAPKPKAPDAQATVGDNFGKAQAHEKAGVDIGKDWDKPRTLSGAEVEQQLIVFDAAATSDLPKAIVLGRWLLECHTFGSPGAAEGVKAMLPQLVAQLETLSPAMPKEGRPHALELFTAVHRLAQSANLALRLPDDAAVAHLSDLRASFAEGVRNANTLDGARESALEHAHTALQKIPTHDSPAAAKQLLALLRELQASEASPALLAAVDMLQKGATPFFDTLSSREATLLNAVSTTLDRIAGKSTSEAGPEKANLASLQRSAIDFLATHLQQTRSALHQLHLDKNAPAEVANTLAPLLARPEKLVAFLHQLGVDDATAKAVLALEPAAIAKVCVIGQRVSHEVGVRLAELKEKFSQPDSFFDLLATYPDIAPSVFAHFGFEQVKTFPVEKLAAPPLRSDEAAVYAAAIALQQSARFAEMQHNAGIMAVSMGGMIAIGALAPFIATGATAVVGTVSVGAVTTTANVTIAATQAGAHIYHATKVQERAEIDLALGVGGEERATQAADDTRRAWAAGGVDVALSALLSAAKITPTRGPLTGGAIGFIKNVVRDSGAGAAREVFSEVCTRRFWHADVEEKKQIILGAIVSGASGGAVGSVIGHGVGLIGTKSIALLFEEQPRPGAPVNVLSEHVAPSGEKVLGSKIDKVVKVDDGKLRVTLKAAGRVEVKGVVPVMRGSNPLHAPVVASRLPAPAQSGSKSFANSVGWFKELSPRIQSNGVAQKLYNKHGAELLAFAKKSPAALRAMLLATEDHALVPMPEIEALSLPQFKRLCVVAEENPVGFVRLLKANQADAIEKFIKSPIEFRGDLDLQTTPPPASKVPRLPAAVFAEKAAVQKQPLSVSWLKALHRNLGGAGELRQHNLTGKHAVHSEIEAKLEAFTGELNARLERGADGKDTAAWAFRELANIHPFADGNERASRLVMDYVLVRRGLKPALLKTTDRDIFASDEEWRQEVGKGVERAGDNRGPEVK